MEVSTSGINSFNTGATSGSQKTEAPQAQPIVESSVQTSTSTSDKVTLSKEALAMSQADHSGGGHPVDPLHSGGGHPVDPQHSGGGHPVDPLHSGGGHPVDPQ